MHVLILGITESGKTTQAFRIARDYKRRGVPRLILDPDRRREWEIVDGIDFITDDPILFLEVCKANKKCAIFVDEAGRMLGRYPKELEWLATESRKFGHRAYFITQRASQLNKTIRTQCSNIFLFQQAPSDCRVLSDEFNRDALMGACNLKKGEYLAKISVDGIVYKGKAW
jgi:hypothetical protein